MTELKPKPVRCGCGGEAVIVQHELFDRIFKWRIHCMECGIETRMHDTEAEAIQAWNRAMSGKVQDCAKNARSSDPDDLISRQDAINAMMALKHEDDERYGCEIPEGFDGQRAVEALEALPSAEPERWIPVSEALPKEHERVLVTIKRSDGEKRVRSGNYFSEYFWIDNGDYWKCNDVLAWMPLPEPYKEGE